MWFVETDAGQSIASISAWWENEPPTPQDLGRIHWVVVHPEYQGRGLGMMTKAMTRLSESHPGAVLGTSSGRVWAMKVYLDFGFHSGARKAWDPTGVDGCTVGTRPSGVGRSRRSWGSHAMFLVFRRGDDTATLELPELGVVHDDISRHLTPSSAERR